MKKTNKIFTICILIFLVILCLVIQTFLFTGCEQIKKIGKGFEERIGKEIEKEIPLESTKISEGLKPESEQILNLCFNEEPQLLIQI